MNFFLKRNGKAI